MKRDFTADIPEIIAATFILALFLTLLGCLIYLGLSSDRVSDVVDSPPIYAADGSQAVVTHKIKSTNNTVLRIEFADGLTCVISDGFNSGGVSCLWSEHGQE